jgi:hypothetical protein
VICSGGCDSSGVLPLPASTKQTQRAETRGEEWESSGQRSGGRWDKALQAIRWDETRVGCYCEINHRIHECIGVDLVVELVIFAIPIEFKIHIRRRRDIKRKTWEWFDYAIALGGVVSDRRMLSFVGSGG